MTMTVRAPDVDDARRLLRAANEQYRPALSAGAFDAYLDMVLDLDSRLDVAELIVVRRDGDAVATVTWFPDARDEGWGGPAGVAGIRSMGVDPGARGLGLGRALLDECVRRSRLVGANALALHTASWLPDAIRLYERYGFVRRPDRDIAASTILPIAPEDEFTALAFELSIADT